MRLSYESRSFETYMAELGEIDLLTRDEEAAIGKRIMDGDEDAVEIMVTRNLRFVISEALKFANYGFPVDDLVQAGAMGMIKAARKFDYRLGNKFISYARFPVIQQMQVCLAQNAWALKLPANTISATSRITAAMDVLFKMRISQPDSKEVRAMVEANHALVAAVMMSKQPTNRLDKTIEGFDTSFKDMIKDEQATTEGMTEPDSNKRMVKKLVSVLSERHQRVLALRFDGEGMTLQEVGDTIGLTRERARQLVQDAIDILVAITPPDILADAGVVIGVDKAACDRRVKEVRKARAARRLLKNRTKEARLAAKQEAVN